VTVTVGEPVGAPKVATTAAVDALASRLRVELLTVPRFKAWLPLATTARAPTLANATEFGPSIEATLIVSTPAMVTGAAPDTLLSVRLIESLEPATAEAIHWKVVAPEPAVFVTFDIFAADAVLAMFVIDRVFEEPLFSRLL